MDRLPSLLAILFLLAACAGSPSGQHIDAGSGPNPVLPQPESKPIPTVKVAPAKGWSGDQKPSAARGFAVSSYATGLDHPRWLYVLPNGDVLVEETNAPERPDDNRGIKAFFMSRAQKKAGAGTPSANRIALLRDADGDGKAEFRSVFLKDLNSPFGMALVGNNFYVANTDAVMRYRYRVASSFIDGSGTKVANLPGGTINHHWTKNLIASQDGKRLYVTVGSNSNVGERGMENEERRAAILEIDAATGATRVFASGLRNPNGLDWHPQSGALWTTVNERDELGNDLVPDYMTSVRDSGFYGWPYSYFGNHVDTRVEPERPDLVAKAIVPDYALGSHTASLGLAYVNGGNLPAPFQRGMFVGQHGSWNRKPRSGYKVIFVPFTDGKPSGPPIDVLTGFVDDEEND